MAEIHGLLLQAISGLDPLNRAGRSATVGMVESTLRKVADALVEQADDVLSGTPEGLTRLGVA